MVYTGFVPMKSPPNFSDSYLHIYVVGADGFNEQNLTLDSPCSLVPNWSPDGEKIL
ncbi:MAG: hypothetical protein IPL78_07095 [Chloroflexi bacterium]|nr:hypothetical protein [Chloroflexota bacterium]